MKRRVNVYNRFIPFEVQTCLNLFLVKSDGSLLLGSCRGRTGASSCVGGGSVGGRADGGRRGAGGMTNSSSRGCRSGSTSRSGLAGREGGGTNWTVRRSAAVGGREDGLSLDAAHDDPGDCLRDALVLDDEKLAPVATQDFQPALCGEARHRVLDVVGAANGEGLEADDALPEVERAGVAEVRLGRGVVVGPRVGVRDVCLCADVLVALVGAVEATLEDELALSDGGLVGVLVDPFADGEGCGGEYFSLLWRRVECL